MLFFLKVWENKANAAKEEYQKAMKEYIALGSSFAGEKSEKTKKSKSKLSVSPSKAGTGTQYKSKEFIEDDDSSSDSDADKKEKVFVFLWWLLCFSIFFLYVFNILICIYSS